MQKEECSITPSGFYLYDIEIKDVDFDNGGLRDIRVTFECKYRRGDIKIVSVFVHDWNAFVQMDPIWYREVVSDIHFELEKFKPSDDDRIFDSRDLQ